MEAEVDSVYASLKKREQWIDDQLEHALSPVVEPSLLDDLRRLDPHADVAVFSDSERERWTNDFAGVLFTPDDKWDPTGYLALKRLQRAVHAQERSDPALFVHPFSAAARSASTGGRLGSRYEDFVRAEEGTHVLYGPEDLPYLRGLWKEEAMLCASSRARLEALEFVLRWYEVSGGVPPPPSVPNSGDQGPRPQPSGRLLDYLRAALELEEAPRNAFGSIAEYLGAIADRVPGEPVQTKAVAMMFSRKNIAPSGVTPEEYRREVERNAAEVLRRTPRRVGGDGQAGAPPSNGG
ncbi:MAG TPA: hypothetical protein EYG39_13940 [Rhodothermales bacterium]|nr:hypothetical protein [Rhodothermales bacterium]